MKLLKNLFILRTESSIKKTMYESLYACRSIYVAAKRSITH